MSEQNITVEYRGTVISYDESHNLWRFVLRGREKSSGSLAGAKEVINNPAPKDKKPFTPISAYQSDWSGASIDLVEITSIAENNYGAQEVWIKSNGRRTKERIDSLFANTEANAELVKKMRNISKDMERLEEERRSLRKGLAKLEIDLTPE